jgi:hypothetical protein
MRVTVFVGLLANEKSAGIEVGDDVAVGVLYEPPGECRNRFIEGSIGIYRIEDGQFLGSTNRSIVLTEGGGEMNDSRTVVGSDELGSNNAPTIGSGRGSQGVERTLITPINQV